MEQTPYIKTGPAAEHLGICRRTFERLRKDGQIPFYKIGENYRYRVEELDRWVSTNRVASLQEAVA